MLKGEHVSRIEVALVSAVAPGSKDYASKAWTRVGAAVVEMLAFAAFLMLGFGAAHSLWPAVPAASYWTCFLLRLGLEAIGACADNRRTISSRSL
jgi:hypothetical protein